MKLVTINPDYRGSFFDDGGQALWDRYFEDPLTCHHAADSGESMILPDGVAANLLIEALTVNGWQDETWPLFFKDYDPGGEHKSLDEIRKAEQ